MPALEGAADIAQARPVAARTGRGPAAAARTGAAAAGHRRRREGRQGTTWRWRRSARRFTRCSLVCPNCGGGTLVSWRLFPSPATAGQIDRWRLGPFSEGFATRVHHTARPDPAGPRGRSRRLVSSRARSGRALDRRPPRTLDAFVAAVLSTVAVLSTPARPEHGRDSWPEHATARTTTRAVFLAPENSCVLFVAAMSPA